MRSSPWQMIVGSRVPRALNSLVDDVARRIHRVGDRLPLARRGQGHRSRRVDNVDAPIALPGHADTLCLAEQPVTRSVVRLIANQEADLAARGR